MMMSPSLQYRWDPSEPLCHTHIRSASLYTQLSLLSQERSRLCLCFNSVKYLDISPPSRAGPARLSLISGLNISGGVIVTSNFSQLSHKSAGSTTLQVGLTHQSFLYEKSTLCFVYKVLSFSSTIYWLLSIHREVNYMSSVETLGPQLLRTMMGKLPSQKY